VERVNKEYRIDIFLVGGTTYSTTLSEQQKDIMVEVLEEKRIERMSFGPDIENNDTYIVNLKNVNLIKISEE
jgi:hypothetical protein